MWRPERVVFVEGCSGVAGGGMAGVGLAGKGRGGMVGCVAADGLKLLFLQSVPLSMWAGLTLSAETVTGFPRTRSCSVFSLRDRTL
jgi:hypothetical protein